jgi:hypothetical protein
MGIESRRQLDGIRFQAGTWGNRTISGTELRTQLASGSVATDKEN